MPSAVTASCHTTTFTISHESSAGLLGYWRRMFKRAEQRVTLHTPQQDDTGAGPRQLFDFPTTLTLPFGIHFTRHLARLPSSQGDSPACVNVNDRRKNAVLLCNTSTACIRQQPLSISLDLPLPPSGGLRTASSDSRPRITDQGDQQPIPIRSGSSPVRPPVCHPCCLACPSCLSVGWGGTYPDGLPRISMLRLLKGSWLGSQAGAAEGAAAGAAAGAEPGDTKGLAPATGTPKPPAEKGFEGAAA